MNTINTNQSIIAMTWDRILQSNEDSEANRLKRLPNGQYSLTINLDELKKKY